MPSWPDGCEEVLERCEESRQKEEEDKGTQNEETASEKKIFFKVSSDIFRSNRND